jgi:protein required for attachment to host cells
MSARAQLWVTAFDRSLARVWACDERGRLHERPGEGLDGRGNSEARAGASSGQPQAPNAGYREQWNQPGFVAHFVKRLAARAEQGGFNQLIVAADPHALGDFRRIAPAALRQRVVAELDRDHVHTPVKALEAALAEHLPRGR